MGLWSRREVKHRQLAGRQVETSRPSRLISTRSAERGGGLLREARVEPTNLLISSDERYLVLVHGYANSRDDAEAAYRKLTKRLDSTWQARTVHVFWPGDGNESSGDGVNASWLYSLKSTFGYSSQPMRRDPLGPFLRDPPTLSAHHAEIGRNRFPDLTKSY
jgi:hypothetical protein